MEWAKEFLLQNFILIFFAIVMIVSSIVRYKRHPRVSIYTILIMIGALALATFQTLENYGKSIVDPDFTLVFAVLGYTFRPLTMYLFFLLNDESKKGRLYFLTALPLLVNTVIYLLTISPELREYIVSFEVVEEEGVKELSFQGGFLRYSSHIVGAIYTLWLLYLTFTTVKFKRIFRLLTMITCTVLIVAAVVIESFFNTNGNIYVLNTAIAFCVLIYYLYVNIEKNELDSLTGLYNGDVYNAKIDDINKIVKAVILYKINLEENVSEGDAYLKNNDILKEVSNIILHNIARSMIVYRIEEDRFFLVTTEDKQEKVMKVYDKIKASLFEKGYKVSIGFAFRSEKNEMIHELYLSAERMIRFDKDAPRTTGTIKKVFPN